MKRKITTLTLLLTIVCLLAGMLILAACNRENDDVPPPIDYSEDTAIMFSQVVTNLKKTLTVGETFGVDLAANFVLDDKTEANKDALYKLTAKGDFGLDKKGADEKSNFVVELNKQNGAVKSTVFGLGYEVIEGVPYFYVNMLDSGYVKANGVSVSALYEMFKPVASDSKASEINYADIIVSMLFGSTGEVKDGVYKFNFNLASTAKQLVPLAPIISNLIQSKAGVNPDDLVESLFGELSYADKGETVTVDSLATLLGYVGATMDLPGTLKLAFNGDGILQNANVDFKYKHLGLEITGASFEMEKAFIGTAGEPINAFDGFTITGKDANGADTSIRSEIVGVNMLNFQINGTAKAYSADAATGQETLNHKYVVSLNSDVNPFALLPLIKSRDTAEILTAVKNLGYFNLTVDEIETDGDKTNNIITLHANFAENKMIVNLDAYQIFGATSFGGVYEFDAFAAVLNKLFDKNAGTAAAADMSSVLSLILSAFSFDNLKENGVIINASVLNALINDLIGLEIQLDKADYLFGGNRLNIKVSDTTYGAAQKVETQSVKNNLTDSFGLMPNKKFVDSVSELHGLIDTYEPGEELRFDSSKYAEYGDPLAAALQIAPRYFLAECTFTDGTTGTAYAHILGSDYDPNKTGKQDITLYLGVATDGLYLDYVVGGMKPDVILSDYPLCGVVTMRASVTVLPRVSAELLP